MTSPDIALSVRGLSKAYTIAHNQERHTTAAEALLHRARNPFQRVEKETFWALKDVSFDVMQGDVVGIIGRNGAGKSTLLKILSGITDPTEGEIALYGRVGSLLEVGTGFHPELTGRENIYLNGAILGMRKKEIDRQFDEIVDFSGVEQFLDTPVKRYSSGMYVRLAFAVAAHLSSEILVVDEVLAVGDAEFQKKCLGKMKDVATSGRTVLFVSHHMQAITGLCREAMVLAAGCMDFAGDSGSAVSRYLSAPQRSTESLIRGRPRTGTRFTGLAVDRQVYLSTDDIEMVAEVQVEDANELCFISLEVINGMGIPVLHLDSRLLNVELRGTGTWTARYRIRSPRLATGGYTVQAYLCTAGGILDRLDAAARFEIAPLLPYPASRGDCIGHAMVYPDFSITVVDGIVGPERSEDGVHHVEAREVVVGAS